MISILHIANGNSQLSPDSNFAKALLEMKDQVELTILDQGKDLSENELLSRMREADVMLTMWGSVMLPAALADDPGKVRYILNLTGTCKPYMPVEIIKSRIPVTNWGDAPAHCIAEGAMTLLLAVMKDLRTRTDSMTAGEWSGVRKLGIPSGTISSLRLGLYGCGAIGTRFVEMITPFKPELIVFDPYAKEVPANCRRVDSLKELFEESEAVAIHAGLSDETEGSVTAELLALLPDHGIIINTARGDIIDQDALFAEIKSGRLRAGLDVLANNDAKPDDPAVQTWSNLIITPHDIAASGWPPRPDSLSPAEENALDNLKRFMQGEELRFIMDEARYNLST